MPMRVDLPAPFSPTTPWIVPRRTTSDTSRLAWTSPNHLSIPRSSVAGGAPLSVTFRSDMWRSERQLCRRNRFLFWERYRRGPSRPPPKLSPPPRLFSHVVGDLDFPGHDVGARLLEPLFHLRSDQAAVVLIERIADAALGDTERAHAGLPRPVLRGLECFVDGEIDALDHRGQDRAGMDVVLVRVDADGEPTLVLGGLEDAEPGRARGGVDDVGAPIELAPGQLATTRRIVPGRRCRSRHVLEDLDLRVDVLRPFFIAEGESPDQRDVHAADEADLAGLRGQRGGHAHEERPLVLLEDDRLDVRQIHDGVDDGELEIRKFLGDFFHAAGLGKADSRDDPGAPTRHVA